jgi:hypothetical protein
MQDNEDDYALVDKISENVSTDTVLDLKSGIYNLFISLINNQVVDYGPQGATEISLDFLREIIYNFEKAIQPTEEK